MTVAPQSLLSMGFPRPEWIAIPFSRGSSKPRNQTWVSCIGRWILYHWATREASWLNYYLVIERESLSVVPVSLQLHGPYSPWNSPGQNTGVGCLFLLQGIFPTQELNPGSHIVGKFFTSWATREATREVIWKLPCGNFYRTSALVSHASKVMLKILQARLQQYVNRELPDVQVGFREGRRTRDQIANTHWIIKKARVPEKHQFLLYWLCQSLWLYGSQKNGKFWKRWEYQTTWSASWKTCMQVRKRQLELDMEQQTGSK